jgi:hypothetical protein
VTACARFLARLRALGWPSDMASDSRGPLGRWCRVLPRCALEPAHLLSLGPPAPLPRPPAQSASPAAAPRVGLQRSPERAASRACASPGSRIAGVAPLGVGQRPTPSSLTLALDRSWAAMHSRAGASHLRNARWSKGGGVTPARPRTRPRSLVFITCRSSPPRRAETAPFSCRAAR